MRKACKDVHELLDLLEGSQIIRFHGNNDGSLFVQEMCDQYFSQELKPSEVKLLIDYLTSIYNRSI